MNKILFLLLLLVGSNTFAYSEKVEKIIDKNSILKHHLLQQINRRSDLFSLSVDEPDEPISSLYLNSLAINLEQCITKNTLSKQDLMLVLNELKETALASNEKLKYYTKVGVPAILPFNILLLFLSPFFHPLTACLTCAGVNHVKSLKAQNDNMLQAVESCSKKLNLNIN